MIEKKRIVLQPEYMKLFNCIGPKCEDSCCIGWSIELDKSTYLKYKKVQDRELKPLFEKMVGRKRSGKSERSYGKIKMEQWKGCPFLDSKNLCRIQGKLGEGYLSDTCALYPRSVNKVDGKIERSATISCPEIARLALLNQSGIALEHIEENTEKRMKVHHNFDTEGHLYMNRPQRYFWEIRIFALSLLQNREYSLDDRLVILGMVYKRIEEYALNGNAKDIPEMLEDFAELIGSGVFKEELGSIPTNTQIQMRIAKEMTDQKLSQGVQSERYLECLKETIIGMDNIEGESINSRLKKYEKNHKEYLAPYLKEKEYILENYLVNEYFREVMPFGEYNSIWDSYIFLCVLYSMVKLHLNGMSGYHKGLDDDLVMKLMQSFSKEVLHSRQYIQGIVRLIKDNNYDRLAYMSILVKN